MRTLFGWFLVVTVAAIASSSARAENTDPMPPEVKAEPKKAEPKPEAKVEAKEPAKEPAKGGEAAKKEAATAVAAKKAEKKDVDELLALTNDPMFAKADRMDGDELKGLVTFTFDDGPNPDTTPAVIDALVKYDIPATFFIVTQRLHGKLGEKSRELLAKEIASGFHIASHSVSHPVLKGGDAALFTREIDASILTLAKAANKPIGLFRAPFGAFDANGRAWLKKRGLTEVRWSIDTLDWKAKSADALRQKVFNMIVAQQGGIVLMHDVKVMTAGIIADVLDDLEAENCRRLVDKKDPIWPVSLHYFVHDKGKQRAIPPEVQKRTDAYKANFFKRCAARPKAKTAPKADVKKDDAKDETKAEPKKDAPKAEPKKDDAKKAAPKAEQKSETKKKPAGKSVAKKRAGKSVAKKHDGKASAKMATAKKRAAKSVAKKHDVAKKPVAKKPPADDE